MVGGVAILKTHKTQHLFGENESFEKTSKIKFKLKKAFMLHVYRLQSQIQQTNDSFLIRFHLIRLKLFHTHNLPYFISQLLLKVSCDCYVA